MPSHEANAWGRTLVLLLGLLALTAGLAAAVQELRTLNERLAVMEREVQRNTETQARLEQWGRDTVKRFGGLD